MLYLTLLSALANPLELERGRYALSVDRALEAREHALQGIDAERSDWRAWHLYQSACTTLAIPTLCKVDLERAGQSEPAVEIVSTWFDFQAGRADIDDLEGDDHRPLRALAMGMLHESDLPEARRAGLLEAVRHAPAEAEATSREALAALPDHPEIQIALWDRDDPTLDKARKRVVKAGRKLAGRPPIELYRWLRLFTAAKLVEQRRQVRALLVDAGEPLQDRDAGPPMSLDASFADADERILRAVSPADRDASLLQVQTRRKLLAGAFRQRLALHGDSRNPRSRHDLVTSDALDGESTRPKMVALACKALRGDSCGDRPDLAAAFADRAQHSSDAGKRDDALVDIVVATLLQPHAPPAWYQLRAKLQGDTVAGFVSRNLAWEVGGDEPEGGLGSGWPGPTDAGEDVALAAIEAWRAQVADPAEPPFDRDRAVRTLETDRHDHTELWRMALLAYLDRDDDEVGKLLRRFIRTYPDDPMGHVLLGITMRRGGRLVEAEAAYRAAIDLAEHDPHGQGHETARIETEGTHQHGAEQEVTFEPTPPEAWSGLAVVLARLDRFDEAQAQLAAVESDGPLLDLDRALVDEAMGNRDAALAHLDWALKTRERLDPWGLKQLRIWLDEEPVFDDLRSSSDFRRLMTQHYGRTGFSARPPADR